MTMDRQPTSPRGIAKAARDRAHREFLETAAARYDAEQVEHRAKMTEQFGAEAVAKVPTKTFAEHAAWSDAADVQYGSRPQQYLGAYSGEQFMAALDERQAITMAYEKARKRPATPEHAEHIARIKAADAVDQYGRPVFTG